MTKDLISRRMTSTKFVSELSDDSPFAFCATIVSY